MGEELESEYPYWRLIMEGIDPRGMDLGAIYKVNALLDMRDDHKAALEAYQEFKLTGGKEQ